MKAYVLHGINDLRFSDIKVPEIKEDEVIVNIKASGICGSDIPRIYKTGTYSYPLIPGHEFSGVVTKLGSNVEPYWNNKRVGVFPLIPCMECEFCKSKDYELCRNYSYLGSRTNGGFAEYCVVPKNNLIELPDNVSFEEASMLEPMAVSVHAIRKAQPKKNDTILICGLGTIGMFTLMFLLEQGFNNILVVGNKEFQKNMAIKLGISCDNYCDINITDINTWLKVKNRSVNIFFECVGKNETINDAIFNTSPNGKVVLIGNPATDISFEKTTYWKILRNQLTVVGSWNSSFTNSKDDDWHYVLGKLSQNKINPSQFISHKFNINDLEKGLNIMKDKSEDYLKILMEEI